MKRCFKCGIEKELSEFYAHPKMGDGHLGKCKECTKKDSDKRDKQLRHSPEYCEKERLRAKEKYHRLNYRIRQFELTKSKPYKNAVYKNLHRHEGISKELNIHHWNYNLPKDYFILHKKIHRFIHRFIVLDKTTLCFKTQTGELLSTKKQHSEYIDKLAQLYLSE